MGVIYKEGKFFTTGCKGTILINNSSDSSTESDPVWASEKNKYVTKSDIKTIEQQINNNTTSIENIKSNDLVEVTEDQVDSLF